MKHFLLGFLICRFCSVAFSTPYFIAPPPDGKDGNAGTINSPWGSFSKANSAVHPGDTVYVRGGLYTASRIVQTRSGAAGAVGRYGDMTPADLRGAVIFRDDLTVEFNRPHGEQLWLFGQDFHAARALAWAGENRIKVPSRVSIMGLENAREYFTQGLTTCEVDFDTIGYLMAHTLINDFAVANTPQGYIRAQAMVVERLTKR